MVTSLLLLAASAALGRAQQREDPEESQAQTDSTQTTSGGGLAGLGQASARVDSTQTAVVPADTLGAAAPGFQWMGPFHPTATFTFGASVQSIDLTGGLDLPWELLEGFRTTSNYQRGFSDFRQRDRQTQTERFNTSWQRNLGKSMRFSARFNRAYQNDEERVSGNTFVVESTDHNGEARLGGGGQLAEGLTQTWGVRGRIQDVTATNRGTENNRTLRFGGASGGLAYTTGAWDLTASLGGDRASGDRQLRGKTAPATTAADTVGAGAAYRGPQRLSLDFDARHIRFEEKRLDFPRNNNGSVDTLNAEPDEIVQDEREERDTDQVAVKTGVLLLPGVAVEGSYSHELTETTFQLNRQGLLQRASDKLDLELTLGHAEASSLMVGYRADRNWNNQRPRDEGFRGREETRSQQASLTLQQALFAQTSLRAIASQELRQFVYEKADNTNDRDELYERFDATLTSQALPNVEATVRGTALFTRYINVDLALVPNNRKDRSYEVATGYTFKGIPRVNLRQECRLNIVFRDYDASNDRDEFNKQAFFSTDGTVMLPGKATLTLRHTFDFRKNGRRDVATEHAYRTTQLRRDHQVTAGASMPIGPFTLRAETRRGQLSDDFRTPRTERSGDLRTSVTGKREFWNKRMALDLKLERVAAYGPRVRAEEEDYLVANSTLTVKF